MKGIRPQYRQPKRISLRGSRRDWQTKYSLHRQPLRARGRLLKCLGQSRLLLLLRTDSLPRLPSSLPRLHQSRPRWAELQQSSRTHLSSRRYRPKHCNRSTNPRRLDLSWSLQEPTPRLLQSDQCLPSTPPYTAFRRTINIVPRACRANKKHRPPVSFGVAHQPVQTLGHQRGLGRRHTSLCPAMRVTLPPPDRHWKAADRAWTCWNPFTSPGPPVR